MEKSKLTGMLTLDELSEKANRDEIETVLLVFTDLYGRFMGKRYDVDFFLNHAKQHGAHGCDYLLTVDMEMEPIPGYNYANWELGYGDFHLVPDFDTLRVVDWLEKTALIICDVKDPKTHEPVPFAPRSILHRQIKRAVKMGFTAMAGSELEYYIFENTYKNAAKAGYTSLEPIGWYIEDYHALQGTREEILNGAARRHLKRSGIPVETSKGEWGLGQHELNICFADVLAMADRHAIFKHCMKEIADQLGLSVTFMAKYDKKQAGSSCHIHLSLWQKDKNVFPGQMQAGPVKASKIFRWFLGGWITHAPDMMVFYAPTVNSYKRYRSGSWAPTRLGWCYDNRTAGFRVVGRAQSLRIECRIPGADCNPYLAYAAALASGLDGIANKIEPPEIFEGDVYTAQHLPHVPKSLKEAIGLFTNSDFAKQSFGEEVVEHYTHFFRVEQEAFENTVTDWEKRRYFERI
ncbi:MAG: glutamine synthetase family protein [bacterium]